MEKNYLILSAIIGSFFSFVFGGWDICLKVLVLIIFLDYVTGLEGAFMQKKVSSGIWRRGDT